MTPSLNVFVRFLWFIFTRLLIWGAIVGLIALSFFAAMDYMNIQALVKDGMQVRAKTVIQQEDPTLLSKVFSRSFLEQDELLNSTIYHQYNVSGFKYKADVGFVLVMPWQNTVTLRVTEQVSDTIAEVISTSDNNAEISPTPPDWDNAVYNVTLVRYEDNWRIVKLELVEMLPKPSPTPSPSESPTPMPSPTPEPTEIDPEDIIED